MYPNLKSMFLTVFCFCIVIASCCAAEDVAIEEATDDIPIGQAIHDEFLVSLGSYTRRALTLMTPLVIKPYTRDYNVIAKDPRFINTSLDLNVNSPYDYKFYNDLEIPWGLNVPTDAHHITVSMIPDLTILLESGRDDTLGSIGLVLEGTNYHLKTGLPGFTDKMFRSGMCEQIMKDSDIYNDLQKVMAHYGLTREEFENLFDSAAEEMEALTSEALFIEASQTSMPLLCEQTVPEVALKQTLLMLGRKTSRIIDHGYQVYRFDWQGSSCYVWLHEDTNDGEPRCIYWLRCFCDDGKQLWFARTAIYKNGPGEMSSDDFERHIAFWYDMFDRPDITLDSYCNPPERKRGGLPSQPFPIFPGIDPNIISYFNLSDSKSDE